MLSLNAPPSVLRKHSTLYLAICQRLWENISCDCIGQIEWPPASVFHYRKRSRNTSTHGSHSTDGSKAVEKQPLICSPSGLRQCRAPVTTSLTCFQRNEIFFKPSRMRKTRNYTGSNQHGNL